MKTSASTVVQPVADGSQDEIQPVAAHTPSLNPEIQAQLGDLLRGMYDELLTRPIPDRFAALLDRLDRESAERRS